MPKLQNKMQVVINQNYPFNAWHRMAVADRCYCKYSTNNVIFSLIELALLQFLVANTEDASVFKPSVSLCFSFFVFSCWDCPKDKHFQGVLSCLSLCFFLLSFSVSLSLWYFPLPQFYPTGTAGDFTPNWLSRRPLSEPFSRSTSGRRDLGCEWCFVYCFSKRGPSLSRSHLSQVPLRPRFTMPDCFCQVARFQARSEQRFPAKFRPQFLVFFHSQRDSKLLSTL